ncbi:MAG: helix-turn-helix domain-containing protein, partial [Bryobacteraceae bacterium]|nr:helix-turn-helix domain-containing protein [Bryobacteraceae bacterium]
MTTKRDTLVRAAFLDALALGQSISAAARLAGVHRSTVYHWNRTDPQVARALAASRADTDAYRHHRDTIKCAQLEL